MRIALFIPILVILFYFIKIFISADFAALFLSIVSILITLTYEEWRKILGIEGQYHADSAKQDTTNYKQKQQSYFQFLDLSFMLVAIVLLGIIVFDSFVYSVKDMVTRDFITFNQEKNAFIHLQTYMGGFVVLPVLSVIFAAYGFLKGYKEETISLWKFIVAISIGSSTVLMFLYIWRGYSPVQTNYDLMALANPNALPVRAKPLEFMTAFGLCIVLVIFMSFYSCVFAILGLGANKITYYKNILKNKYFT